MEDLYSFLETIDEGDLILICSKERKKTLKLLFSHIDEFEHVFLLVVVDHTDYFERWSNKMNMLNR